MFSKSPAEIIPKDEQYDEYAREAEKTSGDKKGDSPGSLRSGEALLETVTNVSLNQDASGIQARRIEIRHVFMLNVPVSQRRLER